MENEEFVLRIKSKNGFKIGQQFKLSYYCAIGDEVTYELPGAEVIIQDHGGGLVFSIISRSEDKIND